MLEPTFLSVAELADRWKQTERQILERGALSRLPLYFLFDGLMFDSGDQWLKSNGVEYTGAQAEYERLRDTVNTWEAVLKRHTAVRRGQIKPSEYEDLPLQPEAVKQYRDEIDTATKRIDELDRCLEQRERERQQSTYYGYLRALPGAIGDILQGKPVAVMYAHHPERGIVAVEGRPVTLAPADLLASMAEVKAIESGQTQKQRKAPPKHSETKSWQEQARQIANELDQRDASVGAHDSITSMAERVAIEMRNRGINGPRGPLSGATIKREALQGKRNMTPPVGWGKRGE